MQLDAPLQVSFRRMLPASNSPGTCRIKRPFSTTLASGCQAWKLAKQQRICPDHVWWRFRNAPFNLKCNIRIWPLKQLLLCYNQNPQTCANELMVQHTIKWHLHNIGKKTASISSRTSRMRSYFSLCWVRMIGSSILTFERGFLDDFECTARGPHWFTMFHSSHIKMLT